MDGTAGVFVGAAVVVVVVGLLFVVLPSRDGSPDGRRVPRLPGASLARGLSGPLGPPRRSRVQERLDRAIGRIDSVDPHVTERRIGQALQQQRPGTPPRSTPARATPPRSRPPANHPSADRTPADRPAPRAEDRP